MGLRSSAHVIPGAVPRLGTGVWAPVPSDGWLFRCRGVQKCSEVQLPSRPRLLNTIALRSLEIDEHKEEDTPCQQLRFPKPLSKREFIILQMIF